MGRPKLTESAKKRKSQDRNRVLNSRKLVCGRHWDRISELLTSSNLGQVEVIGHLLDIHDEHCECTKQKIVQPAEASSSQDTDQQATIETTPHANGRCAMNSISSPSDDASSTSSSWPAAMEVECPVEMEECVSINSTQNIEEPDMPDNLSCEQSCYSDTGAVLGEDIEDLDDDLLHLQVSGQDDNDDDDTVPDSFQPLSDMIEAQKIIAFVEPLVQLVKSSVGPNCRKGRCCEQLIFSHQIVGTALIVKWVCGRGHMDSWSSQPKVKRMFAGNLQLAANVLLTGNAFRKIELLFYFMNLGCIKETTFHQVQRLYAVPAVDKYWMTMQIDIISQKIRLDGPTRLAGDGRNDSPGHSAQFCTYSFADVDTENIVHVEVVDVRQTTSSVAMEKLAFEQGLQFLLSKLKVEEIVTDQNPSVTKLLKSLPQIVHQFDIWHAAKNLEKRLLSACKPRSSLRLWIPSVKNHFWWSAETCKGNATKMKETWVRVLCHVCNVHQWSTGSCSHAQLNGDHQQPWLEKKSEDMDILRSVVLEPRFLKQFPYFRNYRHTGALESFQNHILMYCPKRNSYQYHSYRARNLLAAIDHNHHVNRPEYRTKDGSLQHYAQFNPRSQKWTPRIKKIAKDYNYRYDLQLLVFQERIADESRMNATRPKHPQDPKLIQASRAKIPCPLVKDLVARHVTKF